MRTSFARATAWRPSSIPTDVHEADLALQRAEDAWRKDPDNPSSTDLAVVADRRALIAEAEAEALQAKQETAAAQAQFEANRAAQLRSAESQLGTTQQVLGQTEMQLQNQQANAAAQQRRMQDMEAKLKDARDTISKIASVKDDSRGMVITLPGEVLFRTGKFDLKPAAMAKLDEIAQALKGKEQPVTVYGYTDNVGSRDTNMSLSQSRATAVRDYLVSKGLPSDLVTAVGKGPDDPVADNTSIEGRAQNRRVELVVQPRP